jgi:hypothetical protein
MAKHDMPSHSIGTRKGEEHALGKSEEGRVTHGKSHADRPAGKRTMRDATGINAEDRRPIDPRMPEMPPA